MIVRVFRGRPQEPTWRAHTRDGPDDRHWRRCEVQADYVRLERVRWAVTSDNGYAEGEFSPCCPPLERPRQVFYQRKEGFVDAEGRPVAESASAEFRPDGSAWVG